MRSAPPSRLLRVLAVTLPLGFEPPGSGGSPPRVTLPAEIQADTEAVGALGAVYRAANGGEICAAVALRAGDPAPLLARVESRPARGPARSAPIALAPLADAEVPEGYGLWMGCTPSPAPTGGATVLALLVDPGPTGARRRFVGLHVDAGSAGWRWRALTPFEGGAGLLSAGPARSATGVAGAPPQPDAARP